MENEDEFLQVPVFFEVEQNAKRKICENCRRPETVCFCKYLPKTRVCLQRSSLHILQHPNEDNRCLNTVNILRACLSPNSCHVYKGRRFSGKFPELHALLGNENTFLLYPTQDATELNNLKDFSSHNIIILDGTWKQASSIYSQNSFLHGLKKICINPQCISEYVIRTQPNDKCLSTLECAAIVLQNTEKCTNIKEILMKPLRALCQFQLDHGATIHHSKERRNLDQT